MSRAKDTAEHAGSLYEDAEFDDTVQFRVWPDGTVQAVEDGEPYSHMSDDFQTVFALCEDDAVAMALLA